MGSDKRVLVVGSGSNGLVCAINLARAGLDVTVLEHAPHPGGASSSGEITLPGFVHDHCAAFNPMTVASPAMRELELEDEGLRWINSDAVMAHPFLDGTAIGLHRDLETTVASLEQAHRPPSTHGEFMVGCYPFDGSRSKTCWGRYHPLAPAWC